MKCIINWVFNQLVSGSLFSSSPFTRAKTNQHALVYPQGTKEAENEMYHTHTNVHQESSCQNELCKIEQIRHTFSNILTKTGLLHGSLVSKVVHRLDLAALLCDGSNHGRNISTKCKEFSIRILFIGRTGVGKSATINSIFDEPKAATHAFQPETDHIHEITGTFNGVILKIIDTPGLLLPSPENMKKNRKILISLRRFLRRSPPDVVLYFERLEFVSCSGYDDSRLFDLITDVFGRDIWFNTILVMTHSYSYFQELSHPGAEYYLSRCVEKVRRRIHGAVSDTRLENPILLVENRPLCVGFEKLLPDVYRGWRSRLLLLCLCTKALADAAAVLGVRNSSRIPPSLPLSELFSSSLDSGRLSLFADENGDPDDLTKSHFQNDSEEYIDEPFKKCMKDEAFTRREDPIPLPEMTMPPVFDSDGQSYRYRGVSTPTGVTVRPILDPHSWDHYPGFDGLKMEASAVSRAKLRAGFGVESMRGDSIHTVNAEFCFPTFVRNMMGCCLSVTNFRDEFYGGLRVEDVVSIGKRVKVVMGGGGVSRCGGDSCHGVSVTGVVTGASVFLALTAALVSVNKVGMLSYRGRLDFRPVRGASVSVRGEVGGGKKAVSVRVVTSEHVEIGILLLVFVLRCLLKKVRRKEDV